MLPGLPLGNTFQNVGALPRYSHEVRHLLDEKLRDLRTARDGPANWPTGSSDLSPPDLYMWGYVNNKVYSTPGSNKTQLQMLVTSAICIVQADVLQTAWKTFDKVLNEFVRQIVGHIKYLQTNHITSKVLEYCLKRLHSLLYNKYYSSILRCDRGFWDCLCVLNITEPSHSPSSRAMLSLYTSS